MCALSLFDSCYALGFGKGKGGHGAAEAAGWPWGQQWRHASNEGADGKHTGILGNA